MPTIRTFDGQTRQLSTHSPLRLRIRHRPSPPDPASTPADILRHVVAYLPPRSEDWLAADSACSSWREALLPLWESVESRTEAAAYFAARRRVGTKWRKLEGFLDGEVRSSLHGPATEGHVDELKGAARPFVLPQTLIASLRVHDGERDRGIGRGMYGGARLLSALEMADSIRQWRQHAEDETDLTAQPYHRRTLRMPLFSATGARQIAMELCTDTNELAPSGRILLVSPFAPYAPPFKVLARSWEVFLTLV